MSRRILQDQSIALNNTLSNFDNYYVPIGEKVNVYKFRMVSGSIYLTRYGEVDTNTNANNYQQAFQIYTGKEPIVVCWENSFNATGNKETNKITKRYKVGDYETCYLVNNKEMTKEINTKNLYGKEYTMTTINYNITLQSNTWIPSEDDMRDYLYLIIDKKTQSLKWLEIMSVSPIYNPETNEFQYCEINFNNIADKYTQTGKSILDFVQMGAIGEGYAFPKETHLANGDIVVEVDENYINDLGANTLQLDFTCGAGLSSVFLIGRRKSKKIESDVDGEYAFEVDTPHILWLYDTQTPNISQFFYNQPNLNSYIASKWEPTKEGIWKSYKDAYKANDRIGEYNILNTKEVITGLRHNQSNVRNSNPNMNKYTNWERNKNWNIDFGQQLKWNNNPYILPTENLQRNCSYVDFLNINSMVNFSSYVFDYDYKETKKWKLTDVLGIFGGLVNILVGGLNIGWTTSNVLSQVTNDLNLIVPCISYEDGMLALNNNAPLPLDVFYDDKSQKVLPTSTNVLTSWRFRLTDRIVDTSQVREDAELGKGGNGVWDLKYLGQTKFEDGTYINDDHSPFRFNPLTTNPAFPSNNDFEFIVDYIDYKVLASCDVRISAYDNANDPVYYSITETNGKARGDIRIWGNATKFNYYDRFNTSGDVNYPDYANPPPPEDTLINYEIPEISNFSPFKIDGYFGGISQDMEWNGYYGFGTTRTSSTCTTQWGCAEKGYYYRKFAPNDDNVDYLYKENIKVEKQINFSIETIDINIFKKIKIIFNDDNVYYYNIEDLGKTKEFVIDERLFFNEHYTGKYNNGAYGSIKYNFNKEDKIISGKDAHLLVASTTEYFTLKITFEKDITNIKLKTEVLYPCVYISLNDVASTYPNEWHQNARGKKTIQKFGSDFKDLFSNYFIKKIQLLY